MKMILKSLVVLAAFYSPQIFATEQHRTIHVFVALADNQHQGIAPVPAKIGNGDDAANNLYWGCSEGLKEIFRASREWKLISTTPDPSPQIIERCVFERKSPAATLTADAYRGAKIIHCTSDFFSAAARGDADLVAYIGHDGLMDFEIPPLPENKNTNTPVIVLCCKSEAFFSKPLAEVGAKPLLLTTQLMYPGSFILKNALDGWLCGESAAKIRERAASAYAANQHISLKAARGVFSELR
jgi:hypothetical protein